MNAKNIMFLGAGTALGYLLKKKRDQNTMVSGIFGVRRRRANTQTGTSNRAADRARKAMAPGKRKGYYEYRKNRSDRKGSRI